eukprot:g13414.t1
MPRRYTKYCRLRETSTSLTIHHPLLYVLGIFRPLTNGSTALHATTQALLLDEAKDIDLQGELSALSKQFEQLHSNHRVQLAKAEEHRKQLKHEQAARQAMEQRLADLAMAKRQCEGEVKAWQEQSEALDQEKRCYAQDLRAAQAKEVLSAKEVERLQGAQMDDQRELQHEVRRLREDLHEARRASPQELLLRLKRLEERLQRSELARQQLERKERGSGSLKVVDVAAGSREPKELDLHTLQEIQDTLAAHERGLCEAKKPTEEIPTNGEGGRNGPSLAELERSFGEFARSVGFKGDVSQLWEEAQAVAAKQAGEIPKGREERSIERPWREERPVAADVQLRPSADNQVKGGEQVRLFICSRCQWSCMLCLNCANDPCQECPKCFRRGLPADDLYSDTGNDEELMLEYQQAWRAHNKRPVRRGRGGLKRLLKQEGKLAAEATSAGEPGEEENDVQTGTENEGVTAQSLGRRSLHGRCQNFPVFRLKVGKNGCILCRIKVRQSLMPTNNRPLTAGRGGFQACRWQIWKTLGLNTLGG